jgi:hypothetical protein
MLAPKGPTQGTTDSPARVKPRAGFFTEGSGPAPSTRRSHVETTQGVDFALALAGRL